MSGYSGGSVATDWASELAPAYAPELNIVGVAEAGIPANYFNHFAYIDGTAEYSAAIPGELLGLSRAYGVDLMRYLTPKGQEVVKAESDTCMASDFGKYQLTISDILLPQYQDLAHVRPFSTMVGDQTMGTARTHPKGPLLMAVGNSDGKGDGANQASSIRLLGFSRMDDQLRAVVQVKNDIVAVQQGDLVNGVEVVAVDVDGVSLQVPGRRWTLRLFEKNTSSQVVVARAASPVSDSIAKPVETAARETTAKPPVARESGESN
jgi:hypothetical protein